MGRQRKHPGEARSAARRWALQALYQWQLTGQPMGEVIVQFLADLLPTDESEEGEAEDGIAREADRAYFTELLEGVAAERATLDQLISEWVDRPLEQVDPVERAALRLGAFELKFRLDVPYRVAINEAVELAKLFGGEQGHRYVNSVLDKVARVVRTAEMGAKRP